MCRDGKFIVAANGHFMALRKQDGALELNPTNRTHVWHSITVDDLRRPVSYSTETSSWRLNPRMCSGFFLIEDSSLSLQQVDVRLCPVSRNVLIDNSGGLPIHTKRVGDIGEHQTKQYSSVIISGVVKW